MKTLAAHFLIRRGWSLAQTGELTVAGAQFLLAEEPWHDGVWQLMEFGSRAMGGAGVIPARRGSGSDASAGMAQVIPEIQRQLAELGWRGPDDARAGE